mmetsp:Transcript_81303/g.230764  ORF Transcript_81303/g.230764 Transcript_81303/m.230764 type:complete len:631 (-) Transcript_81303:410-2302(-)
MFGGLFGGGGPKSAGEAALASAGMPNDGDGKKKGKKDEEYKGGGFDPRGLERAAKAAKVLDNSPNTKLIFEVIQEEQKTKQMEHQVQAAQYQAYQDQLAVERVGKEAEEQRRTLGAKTEHHKEVAKYNDRLERERFVGQLNAKKQLQEQEIKRQDELAERQAALKRKNIEHEAKLRQETELKRVEEETKGRIRQERDNHDLRLEQAKLEASEQRQTVLEGIKLAGSTLGEGARAFLSDKEKMAAAVATLSAIALGVYSAKVGTGVAGRYVEARLGKPSLVRETSRSSVLADLRSPVATMKRIMASTDASEALSGVVLEPKLADRLSRVATSTSNTKRNKAPFRHLLLYGPPGTGKTMFAKGLARSSGLEYAILTGGDVAPLGRDAVTEIHKVFDWANTSKKGLLLFIDESDAFLRKRSTENISEDLRNALNAFLYRTGEPTDKFMLVYASNQPEQVSVGSPPSHHLAASTTQSLSTVTLASITPALCLLTALPPRRSNQFDWAVNDRIDEMVEFDLPGLEERRRMIDMYLSKYLRDAEGSSSGAKKIVVSFDGEGGGYDKILDQAAARTDGFSGREIAKLAIAWQASAYGSSDNTFTEQLLDTTLSAHIDQKKRKELWNEAAGGSAMYLK